MFERTAKEWREPATERPEPRIERLEIRNLTKRFGDLVALDRFDLEVEGGEFISLLGPSGCGKTTALNCLSGLLEPDEGDIELDGESILSVPSERRQFGMVFQNYALFPHLTIARNVSFGLEMQGMDKPGIRERVGEVLSLVQLEEHRDKHPAQLSGGQQQRIALARAIATRPRIILMDEPLSNLDAKLRLEMRAEFRRLHQTLGLTTVYVTHDQEEALSLSDRVVLMRNGSIQQVDSPEVAYASPASAYAANFLGYRNLLPVRVAAVEGARATGTTETGVELSGTLAGKLSPGDEAVAAIRPEDVNVLPRGQEEPNVVSATVELVEFLGRDTELSMPSELGSNLIARTTAGDWRPGSRVSLRLPPERLLIFPEED
ncbi:MAG: ABC transporter ATP-binding protein [Rubrobacteraceae bacterium]